MTGTAPDVSAGGSSSPVRSRLPSALRQGRRFSSGGPTEHSPLVNHETGSAPPIPREPNQGG
jgi:hypothetical protein